MMEIVFGQVDYYYFLILEKVTFTNIILVDWFCKYNFSQLL